MVYYFVPLSTFVAWNMTSTQNLKNIHSISMLCYFVPFCFFPCLNTRKILNYQFWTSSLFTPTIIFIPNFKVLAIVDLSITLLYHVVPFKTYRSLKVIGSKNLSLFQSDPLSNLHEKSNLHDIRDRTILLLFVLQLLVVFVPMKYDYSKNITLSHQLITFQKGYTQKNVQ